MSKNFKQNYYNNDYISEAHEIANLSNMQKTPIINNNNFRFLGINCPVSHNPLDDLSNLNSVTISVNNDRNISYPTYLIFGKFYKDSKMIKKLLFTSHIFYENKCYLSLERFKKNVYYTLNKITGHSFVDQKIMQVYHQEGNNYKCCGCCLNGAFCCKGLNKYRPSLYKAFPLYHTIKDDDDLIDINAFARNRNIINNSDTNNTANSGGGTIISTPTSNPNPNSSLMRRKPVMQAPTLRSSGCNIILNVYNDDGNKTLFKISGKICQLGMIFMYTGCTFSSYFEIYKEDSTQRVGDAYINSHIHKYCRCGLYDFISINFPAYSNIEEKIKLILAMEYIANI